MIPPILSVFLLFIITQVCLFYILFISNSSTAAYLMFYLSYLSLSQLPECYCTGGRDIQRIYTMRHWNHYRIIAVCNCLRRQSVSFCSQYHCRLSSFISSGSSMLAESSFKAIAAVLNPNSRNIFIPSSGQITELSTNVHGIWNTVPILTRLARL